MKNQAALTAMRHWRESPLQFVRSQFRIEPDEWQAEALEAVPRNPRVAMRACKGPGKTAVLAWIAWWFLATRPHPKVAATSISGDNLADGLWTELATWQSRSEMLKAAFTWTKTRVFAKEAPETWWASARTWAKGADRTQQANTLAGLHADNLMFLVDEAGGVPDSVLAAAEAGLANAGVGHDGKKREAHLIIAGNPTHTEGPLYRACVTDRHQWWVAEITADPDSPKRTPRVSRQWALDQIEKYGRDNPWVLVNVFGQFPPSSINALIGPDEVRAAMKRNALPDAHAPRILGADVAREGDDRSCIVQRWGRVMLPPKIMRNVDSLQGAGAVAALWRDWGAHGCFIDNTGGWGGGWVDQLRAIGYSPTPVVFSSSPTDRRFLNKRAEIWWQMVQWIKEGGSLPDVPDLVAELSTPTYSFKGDRILIEDKDLVKVRLGRSPDIADALALTFTAPVLATSQTGEADILAVIHGVRGTKPPKPSRGAGHDPWAVLDQ